MRCTNEWGGGWCFKEYKDPHTTKFKSNFLTFAFYSQWQKRNEWGGEECV